MIISTENSFSLTIAVGVSSYFGYIFFHEQAILANFRSDVTAVFLLSKVIHNTVSDTRSV